MRPGDLVTNGHVTFRIWSVMDGWAWVHPTSAMARWKQAEGPLTFRVRDLTALRTTEQHSPAKQMKED